MVGGLVSLTGGKFPPPQYRKSTLKPVHTGYAWYYFSGTQQVVSTARSTFSQFENAKTIISSKTPKKGEISVFLRSTFGPYLTFIPGATASLDELDKLAESHGDELNKILYAAYDDLKDTTTTGGFDSDTATRIAEVLTRLSKDLTDLGEDAGRKVLDDNPQLKEQVGTGLEKLRELGGAYGPEAQRIVDQTRKDIQELMDQGINPQSIAKATKMLKEKTQQVKNLGQDAAEKAWDRGSKEAERYLEKMPQVKKVVDEYKDSIKTMALSGGLSTSMIPQVFEKVKEAATSGGDGKQNVEKLRKYFDELSQHGKGKFEDFQGSDGWQGVVTMAEKYMNSFPGGDQVRYYIVLDLLGGGANALCQALKQASDLSEFFTMSEKKGPEAEKLLKETFEEISGVLERRSSEAKKLLAKNDKN